MLRKIIIGSLLLLSCCTYRIYSSAAVPASRETLLERAESYQKKGRYLEALSFYKDIYMNMSAWSDQASASLYKGLGDLYYDYLGDNESALAAYALFLEKFPAEARAPAVYHVMAKIYYKKGERENAVKFYTDILSLFPGYYADRHIDEELKAIEQADRLFEDVALSIDRQLPQSIRVLVDESRDPVEVASKGGLSIVSSDASFFMKLSAGSAVKLFSDNSSICLDDSSALTAAIKITPADSQSITINGRSYRGSILIQAEQDRLLVINQVDLDEYLYGVLPREVSPSWPEQALKAQAVAARTYALYHMIKREKEPFDVFSTTSSQVYGGREGEAPAAQNAVDATRSLVVTYDRKIALTLFHANSGGQTEQTDGVWGFHLPYITNVRDAFSLNQPGCAWEKTLTLDEIQESMKKFALPVSRLEDIIPLERGLSGRIKTLKISQGKESFFLSGNSFRLIVGATKVKSTNFEIKKKKSSFIFKGSGYGHGAGMSQWGAFTMSKSGYDFKQILQFYYPGTKIEAIKIQF